MTKDRALRVLDVYASVNGSGQCTQDEFEEAKKMAIEALEGKDTNVPGRKGVFIPDITVEMFRNASLEGVEGLMESGEMEDISLPSAQSTMGQQNGGDTVSRQMAIDTVEESRRLNHHQDGKAALAHEHEHRHFLKILMELPPAQPEQRWIPCSERIPEEYGEYLISWTTSQSKRQFIEICECEVTSEYDYEHERFECEWLLDDYITNYPDVTVIAWMPLPEPYKEGTDD